MIRRRGNAYQADVVINGKRKRKQFASFEQAKAWESTQVAAEGRSVPSGNYTPEGFKSVSTRLLSVLWGGNEKHISIVRRHLEEVGEVIGDIPVSEFDDTHVEKLLVHYRKKGNSNATINRKWATLSKLCRHMNRTRLLPVMPHFPRQKEPVGRIRFLTHEEENGLFHWLNQFNEQEYRLAVFLVDTGARLGEALKLQGRDIDYHRRTVTFWETKANTHRTVYLTERALHVLRACPDQGRPFGDINRWTFRDHWNKAKSLSGLGEDDQVVPHVLRHTCASRLVQGGADLRRVQEWMGHKSMQMTMRYAHLAPRDLESCLVALEGGRGEMVDAAGLKPAPERGEGSTPSVHTNLRVVK